jgi:hypothetical protein
VFDLTEELVEETEVVGFVDELVDATAVLVEFNKVELLV